MSTTTTIGRRDAVRHLLLVPAAITLPAWLLSGCKGGNPPLACNDTSTLPPDDLKARVVTFAYVEAAPDPTQRCSGCELFKPAAENQCGGCSVVKGPINPNGWCKSFKAKAAQAGQQSSTM